MELLNKLLSNLTSEENKAAVPWEFKKLAESRRMRRIKEMGQGMESSRLDIENIRANALEWEATKKWEKYREPLGFSCS